MTKEVVIKYKGQYVKAVLFDIKNKLLFVAFEFERSIRVKAFTRSELVKFAINFWLNKNSLLIFTTLFTLLVAIFCNGVWNTYSLSKLVKNHCFFLS